MKFKHYLDRAKESEEYKRFKKKHPEAYLCAGFFVLDFETDKNAHQIDYRLPDGKIATFLLDEGVKMKISEQAIKKELPEIKTQAKTDLDALKGIAEDEMKNRTVTDRIRKMIAVLHIIDNKLVWNLQCILDGLALLNIHVDDSDQSVLKFEKHSLLDLIKTIPMGGGGAMPGGMAMPNPLQQQQPAEQIQKEEGEQERQEGGGAKILLLKPKEVEELEKKLEKELAKKKSGKPEEATAEKKKIVEQKKTKKSKTEKTAKKK